MKHAVVGIVASAFFTGFLLSSVLTRVDHPEIADDMYFPMVGLAISVIGMTIQSLYIWHMCRSIEDLEQQRKQNDLPHPRKNPVAR